MRYTVGRLRPPAGGQLIEKHCNEHQKAQNVAWFREMELILTQNKQKPDRNIINTVRSQQISGTLPNERYTGYFLVLRATQPHHIMMPSQANAC
jgi:hypothetical protein